jgi:hypothetical protein
VAGTACDSGLQGDLAENQPPNTNLTVDQINRSGANRLPSQITITWWGDDPDGYITGYEYSINDGDWNFTTRTDSTFILPIPEGNLTADVSFSVRAIDNEETRDPEPASLVYPIVNTPPTIEINRQINQPDTTYNIASISWNANDPDGAANLERVEVALNSPDNWVSLASDISRITLNINDRVVTESTNASILIGDSFTDSGSEFSTVKLNDKNLFYIRSVDRAGAVSEIDTLGWYIKKRTSRVLLINDIQSEDGTYFRRDYHIQKLNEAGIPDVDVWNMNDGQVAAGQRVQLSSKFFDVSQLGSVGAFAMDQWDFVYFISTNFDRNIYYAPQMLSRFIDNGGNAIFFSPPKEIDERHPLLTFLPYNGLTQRPSGTRSFEIKSDSLITPTENITGAPTLKVENNIVAAQPIELIGNGTALYNADFIVNLFRGTREYDGNETISTKSGEGNIIYFSLDIEQLDADNNVDELVKTLTIDELGFQAN